MSCDEVARLLACDALLEEVGGEAALRRHGATCAACRAAIDAFLADEALLQASFAKAARRSPSRRRTVALAGFTALAASLLIALFVALRARAPAVAPIVARVSATAGEVVVAGDGGDLETPVGPGFDLREGRSLTTRAGATTALRLADGSVVAVNSDSSLRLGPGRDFGVSAYLIHGRVRCRVRPGDAPFRIATPRGEVVAVGTEFEVAYAPAGDEGGSRVSQRDPTGVSVMTRSGGLPLAAVLTVVVASGAVEFRDVPNARGAGLVAAVNAQEVLVASGDEAPRVVKMTGGASPVDVPAFDADHVRSIGRMVSALALSPDGSHLAVCIRNVNGGEIGDGAPRFVGVNLWNVASDRLDGFVALDGSPSCAAFTSDGRLWATEAMNNEMRRVDFAAHGVAETLDLNNPPNQLTSDDARIYPSPDGKHVVVTGFNTSKAVYAYPGWKREAVLEGPTDCLPCEGGWSKDGRSFVAATLENVIKVWPIPATGGARPRNAGTGIAPLFGPDGKVWALTPDAKAFGPSEAEGEARRPFVSGGAAFNEARFSADGTRLALGDCDGTVFIYDVATRKRLHVVEYTPPPEATGSVSCLLWAQDGSWLAVGRFDGSSCIVRCDGK
jgi:WD40 repeat protein